MFPVEARSHNRRKPLLRAGGNGFQLLRKAYSVSVLQQTEIVATRVLKVPKKRHFLNFLHFRVCTTPYKSFCSKKHGACLPVFLRKGVF
jgi:hypothetical protein